MTQSASNVFEPAADTPQDESGENKLVPVAEAIRYRRRAQQAETRLEQFEQQLQELQSQMTQRDEQLAAADALRDETATQVTILENRLAAERLLGKTGVVDLETADMLLSHRLDFSEPLDGDTLRRGVEQLLLDKPFLRSLGDANLPGPTAGVRGRDNTAAQLSEAAEAAARTGDRRDVARYLRLRRQAAQ
jgi:hypothetical protein